MKKMSVLVLLLAAAVSWAEDEPAKLLETAEPTEVSEPATPAVEQAEPAKPAVEQKSAPGISASQEVLEERQALVEHFEDRVVPLDQSVEIKESKGKIEITLRHSQLFLPGLDIFRDNALESIQKAVDTVRANPDKRVILRSVSRYRGEKPLAFTSSVPMELSQDVYRPEGEKADIQSITSESKDLEAHRSFILFTHILQQAWGKTQ